MHPMDTRNGRPGPARAGQAGPFGQARGPWLWADGRSGKAAALTPEVLIAAHPLWGFDVHALAPWTLGPGPALAGVVQQLYQAGGGKGGRHPVLVCGHATSVLDVAWELAEAGWLEGHASVLAVSQECGRGQLRRAWCSPPGNLYVAWYWPELAGPWPGLASLLAGYALGGALRRQLPDVRLKWPNDLLLSDSRGDLKVGGILVEERRGRIMVGFGLNLVSAPHLDELRHDAAIPAGYLNMLCQGRGPLHLWMQLHDEAQRLLHGAMAGTPKQFLRHLEGMLAWFGRQVRVRDEGGEERIGVLAGLAEDGGLRLAGDDGEEILYGGSIYPLY